MMQLWILLALFLASQAPPSVRGKLTGEQKAAFTNHGVNISDGGSDYDFYHSGIPDHPYGPFPNPHNPNTVEPQGHHFYILVPTAPKQRTDPDTGCLNMGPIGVAVNGIPLYNPFNIEGYDAVSGNCAEVFDSCNGHPEMRGIYHYHQISNCVYKGGNDEILGVALDGYLIYGPKNASGAIVPASDLDKCGGTIGPDDVYRYHAQYTYPYIIGCYHGDLSPNQKPAMGCIKPQICPRD